MRRLISFLLLHAFAAAQLATTFCPADGDADGAARHAHHAPGAALVHTDTHGDDAHARHRSMHDGSAHHDAAEDVGAGSRPSHDAECASVSRCHSAALPMQQRRATPVPAVHKDPALRAPTRVATTLLQPTTPPPKPIA